jgi:Holliday junction resolvasome RuvABC endonuclease subunit
MSFLSLDISSVSTGYVLCNEDGTFIKKGKICPDKEETHFGKVKYIVDNVSQMFPEAEKLVIEGIYLGSNPTVFEYLANIHGAIIYNWMKLHNNIPTIIKAISARPLVGLKGSCSKCEGQVWVCKKFLDINEEKIDEYEEMINALYAEKSTKQITQNQFKYRIDKLSLLIEEETGLGNDLADAIILSQAYCKSIQINKDKNV